MGYLLEVGLSRLDKVYDRQVWDSLSRSVDVLVHQDVAVAERAHVHYWCHDVLTIRVKNKGFEGKEGLGNVAAVTHLYFMVFVREVALVLTCLL